MTKEEQTNKLNLMRDAAEFLAADMKNVMKETEMNQKLKDFLDSEIFVETIHYIIYETNKAVVKPQQHLSSKEDLTILKDGTATTEDLLNICQKLRYGMQRCIQKSKHLDYCTILFQGLLVYYTDNLTSKLESKEQ